MYVTGKGVWGVKHFFIKLVFNPQINANHKTISCDRQVFKRPGDEQLGCSNAFSMTLWSICDGHGF